METFHNRERYSLLFLSVLALLLFFTPLLTIQVPMAGEQPITGYDVVSRANNLRENMKSASSEQNEGSTPKLPQRRTPPDAAEPNIELPPASSSRG